MYTISTPLNQYLEQCNVLLQKSALIVLKHTQTYADVLKKVLKGDFIANILHYHASLCLGRVYDNDH